MEKKSIKLSTRLKSRVEEAQVFVKKVEQGDFPGSPVVKALNFQIRVHRGTKILHAMQPI